MNKKLRARGGINQKTETFRRGMHIATLDILILSVSITHIMLRKSITMEDPDVRNRIARTHRPTV
jgi:hypothetical protein